MTYSFIQRSGSDFTDTGLKKMTLDPMVIDGVLARLDFLNAYSNPNADGALVGGAVFKNLVQGGPDATYVSSLGGMSVAAGKKGVSSPASDLTGSSYIGFPNGELDMHTESGDHSFIAHLWYKQIAGYPANGIQMLGDYGNETSAYWGMQPSAMFLFTGIGALGATPNVLLRSGGAATNTGNLPNDSLLGAAHLVSAAYSGGNLQLYIDGGFAASTAFSGATTPGLPSRRSHGTLVFAGNAAAADTVTVNGNVITFVAAGAAGAQVNIGADATATAQALKAYINLNKVVLGATAEGAAATIAVIQRAVSTILTLAKAGANITVGAVVAPKRLRLVNGLKGDFYCLAFEDLTVSGRTPLASAQAEFAGYRTKLVAAGLAV